MDILRGAHRASVVCVRFARTCGCGGGSEPAASVWCCGPRRQRYGEGGEVVKTGALTQRQVWWWFDVGRCWWWDVEREATSRAPSGTKRSLGGYRWRP